MCGITGFIGKRVNIEKFKIVTIWNDTRGKHSCGLYYDNQVFYGVDKHSKMIDFLQIHQIPTKLKNPTIMLGHSRSATWGSHTADNAHPITISQGKDRWHTNIPRDHKDFEGENYLLIGVHNGKLHNWVDLRDAAKDELHYSSFNMDSKILFGRILLEKDNPKDILESYRGAAAIMYTTDNGETLNVFKGGAGGSEERPLYFLQEPEGYYFSSMVEPLLTIKTTNNKVYNMKVNTLMTFSSKGYEGKVEFDRAKDMDLEEKKHYSTGPYARTGQSSFSDVSEDADEYTPRGSKRGITSDNDTNHNNNLLLKIEKEMKNKDIVGHLTWRNFRYEYRAKPINGRLMLDTMGCVNEKEGRPYWFYEGILVSEEGFLQIAKRMIESNDDLFEEISMYSRYPIYARCKNDVFRNRTECGLLTYRGKVFTGNVRPAFFSHGYVVKDGKFVDAKIRAVDRTKLYMDQLFFTNTNNVIVQVLRDHTGSNERTVEAGSADTSDESEHATLKLIDPKRLSSFLGQRPDLRKRRMLLGSEDIRPDFNIPYQPSLLDNPPFMIEGLERLKKLDNLNMKNKDNKSEELGNAYEDLFQSEEGVADLTDDDFEITEETWGMGVEDADFEEVLDDDAESFLEAVTQYEFEHHLETDLKDLVQELSAVIIKYGNVYKKKGMGSPRAFSMLQAASDSIELLEKNVG